MKKLLILAFISATIAACGGGVGGSDKTETYEGYDVSGAITDYSVTDIQIRQLEMINAVRAENGLNALQLSPQLTDAALTHARDIAQQQRAWNFGSDKSTPQTRAQRKGFSGVVTGENVSESYRGEVEVMQSWLREPMARSVILDREATHVGVAFYMDRSGKVWWVEDFGAIGETQAP